MAVRKIPSAVVKTWLAEVYPQGRDGPWKCKMAKPWHGGNTCWPSPSSSQSPLLRVKDD